MRRVGKLTVKLLVDGGKASAGPPLGPSLAPAKINISNVVAAINEKTKEFSGMQVPVDVVVDTETKNFTIKVGAPSVAALIKKELKKEKLAKAPFGTYVPKEGETIEKFEGDLKFESVVKIAKAKIDSMGTKDLKKAVKQVVGSCVSLGVNVEGKHPKEILKEIDSGHFDNKIKQA